MTYRTITVYTENDNELEIEVTCEPGCKQTWDSPGEPAYAIPTGNVWLTVGKRRRKLTPKQADIALERFEAEVDEYDAEDAIRDDYEYHQDMLCDRYRDEGF